MREARADWQLPPGVTRGLWEYVHDAALARAYDASLADSTLSTLDLRFAEHYFQHPGRLLDLGCGTGRLLIPFARRGFWVLGVDLSDEMLRAAGEKAASAGVAVQRLKANLVELGCLADESFDYAACLFSTLGMIIGAAERRRVVAHVHRLLRPGGTFIVHVHNRWFNCWDSQGRHWLVRDMLRSLCLGTEPGNCVMPVHQGIAGLTLHLFTRREAVQLLMNAGFRLLEARPVSLTSAVPRRCAWLRAYGYTAPG